MTGKISGYKISPTVEVEIKFLIEDVARKSGLKKAEVVSCMLFLSYEKCSGKKVEDFLSAERLKKYTIFLKYCHFVVQPTLF